MDVKSLQIGLEMPGHSVDVRTTRAHLSTFVVILRRHGKILLVLRNYVMLTERWRIPQN